MIVVIGYGNPLRGCDKFGIELANAMSEYCDTIITQQLTIDLVQKLERYDTVIFADCAYGSPSLTIACAINDSASPISHKVNLFDFVNFAKLYCDKDFDFVLYSVLCDRYEYGEEIDLSTQINVIKEYILKSILTD